MREAYPNELYHHGIRGQKWGVRRYQNPDGTLTTAGKIRYGVGKAVKTAKKNFNDHFISKEDIKTAKKNLNDHFISKEDIKTAKKNVNEHLLGVKNGKRMPNGDDDSEMSKEERKQRLINSADSKELRKFASELSIEEYRQAVERVRLDASLKEIEHQQKMRKLKTYDDFVNRAKNTTMTVNDIWNTTASINNIVNPKHKLPTLDTTIYDPIEDKFLNKEEVELRKSYQDYKNKKADYNLKKQQFEQNKGKK